MLIVENENGVFRLRRIKSENMILNQLVGDNYNLLMSDEEAEVIFERTGIASYETIAKYLILKDETSKIWAIYGFENDEMYEANEKDNIRMSSHEGRFFIEDVDENGKVWRIYDFESRRWYYSSNSDSIRMSSHEERFFIEEVDETSKVKAIYDFERKRWYKAEEDHILKMSSYEGSFFIKDVDETGKVKAIYDLNNSRAI